MIIVITIMVIIMVDFHITGSFQKNRNSTRATTRRHVALGLIDLIYKLPDVGIHSSDG